MSLIPFLSIFPLPAGIKVACTQLGSGYFEASVWDVTDGRECLSVEEGTTRLSAIRAATETYWAQRIFTAQLLTESLR